MIYALIDLNSVLSFFCSFYAAQPSIWNLISVNERSPEIKMHERRNNKKKKLIEHIEAGCASCRCILLFFRDSNCRHNALALTSTACAFENVPPRRKEIKFNVFRDLRGSNVWAEYEFCSFFRWIDSGVPFVMNIFLAPVNAPAEWVCGGHHTESFS